MLFFTNITLFVCQFCNTDLLRCSLLPFHWGLCLPFLLPLSEFAWMPSTFVSQFRRPDVAHFKTIGAWYRILEWVTKISVLVNAFVLAFTSEFIPKLLYRLKYAPDHDSPGGGTLAGYINNSLSTIHTVDIFRYEPGTEPENPYDNLPYNNSVCRYEF